MKKIAFVVAAALAVSGCKTVEQNRAEPVAQENVANAASDNWVAQSDAIAEEYTRSFSTLYPELGSSLGYQEYDSQGLDLSADFDAKEAALLLKWQSRLKNQLEQPLSKNLRVDLRILLEQVEDSIKGNEVGQQIGSVTFRQASRMVYGNLMSLINEQSPARRKADAVSRFKYYMSSEGKDTLVMACKQEYLRNLEQFKNQDKLFVFAGEVNRYLENSETYVAGVKQLLEQSGRDDWAEEFELFKSQVAEYDAFVKSDILPKARKTPNLPRDVYQLRLKGVGVDATPEALIENGQKDFDTIYQEFAQVAAKIAAKNSLEKNDPASVIRHLKTKQVASIEQVSKLYNGASDKLERIIRANQLVSLPQKRLKIRFAGDAESKAAPVPHLIPPPLIDNNGIVPEFVVPTSSTGQLPFDDFAFESAATVLTAHEGRPGHDLQFSKMLENPVSIVRARYAMNSVNVEGWALWAEDLVYPYLNDEEKLIALQTRLWRVARYFLDPMVQLGQANQEKVVDVFHNKLGVSKTMAGLEFQRYAFRSPAQATAYYHGLLNIIELKKDLNQQYGELNLKCFNDTLLSFGLLPHKQIRLFKEQFKACAD